MSKRIKTTTTSNDNTLTSAQYQRWAKLAFVSVGAVMTYHQLTGKAPKPGFRRVNPVLEFPGLCQLHAAHEAFSASLEASVMRCRAEERMTKAIKEYTEAKELETAIDRARSLMHGAFRTLANVEAQKHASEASLHSQIAALND